MAATGSFDFSASTIGKVLKERRLIVPPNQRSYSWEVQHVIELLQDFDQAIEKDDYFLGTIVLVGNMKGRQVVQDGQQRLATTTILLARIRDALMAVKREGSARSIDGDFIQTVDRDTEENVPKLTLNTEDNDCFVREIIAFPSEADAAQGEFARQSNKRLRAASAAISAFLKDKLKLLPEDRRADWLLKWTNFVEKSASVVVVTVSDEVSAYRIFETLNDRGLKASQADILKNYLFSKAGDRLHEAQARWNAIVGLIESIAENDGDTILITFLRHYWITKHGPTKERELAGRMRVELTGQAKVMQLLSECSDAAQMYLALHNPSDARWGSHKASVRKHLEIITTQLQVEQIKPLLFAVAMKFDSVEIEKAFRLFVSWSVRFLIFGGRGGMLDQQYSLRAHEVGTGRISKARELRDAMKQYVPSDAEFQEAFATARVSRSRLAKYYLRALEKKRASKSEPEYVINEDIREITLEHVMPLNPGAGWAEDEETAQAAQKLLGNMVLLQATANRDLGNADFHDKKAVLAASSYQTTKEVAEYEEWGIAAIRDRQAKLAATAVETWSMKFVDD